MRLALAGPSGVGKSTVGGLLAARAGLVLVDLDDRIVTAAGLTVEEIFAAEGEAGFRERETRAVDAVAGMDGVVLALGGGTLGAVPRGPGPLLAWPRVVLMAEPSTLLSRLGPGADAGRPLLRGDRGRVVTSLWSVRRANWRAFGLFVHTDGVAPGAVAERVEAVWRS